MRISILVFAFLFLIGCASVRQGIGDYFAGKKTPIAEGETSPKDEAQTITQFLSGLPFVGPFAPVAGTVLTGFFTWRRGRRIRLGMESSPNPATGFLGKATGIETIVQTLSNIAKGAFEVGPENSGVKRGWKVFLSTSVGILTLAFAVPQVQTFVLANPGLTAGISALSGLFAGLEKSLSNVKPVNS